MGDLIASIEEGLCCDSVEKLNVAMSGRVGTGAGIGAVAVGTGVYTSFSSTTVAVVGLGMISCGTDTRRLFAVNECREACGDMSESPF